MQDIEEIYNNYAQIVYKYIFCLTKNKELSEWIRKDLDSVILFKSRSNRWMKKEMWGKNDDATDNFI